MPRIPGIYPSTKLLLTGFETARALFRRQLETLPDPVADAPRVDEIPSVSELGSRDRVLAEIDQDGFAFAVNAADQALFNRRSEKLRRRRYELDIVLHDGAVCVRKSFQRQWADAGGLDRMWAGLGLQFLTEATALLRLADLSFTPTLRDIDLRSKTIYMDYILGPSLQRKLAKLEDQLLDLDQVGTPSAVDDAREKREHVAFQRHASAELRSSIEQMIVAMNERGVAPMDVKLGNIVIGERTGRAYWIDFELAALRPHFAYGAQLAEHRRMVDDWFGLSLSR